MMILVWTFFLLFGVFIDAKHCPRICGRVRKSPKNELKLKYFGFFSSLLDLHSFLLPLHLLTSTREWTIREFLAWTETTEIKIEIERLPSLETSAIANHKLISKLLWQPIYTVLHMYMNLGINPLRICNF